MEEQFNKEEIEAAKRMRDEIISLKDAQLSSIYIAGEIVMYDEVKSQLKQVEQERDEVLSFLEKANNWMSNLIDWSTTKKVDMDPPVLEIDIFLQAIKNTKKIEG